MKSNNINNAEWSDRFILPKSILITVFLGAFVLWNCGGAGMFSVMKGMSVSPIWEFKNVWGVLQLEITGLMSAGIQTFIFVYACGATNVIGESINNWCEHKKSQSK